MATEARLIVNGVRPSNCNSIDRSTGPSHRGPGYKMADWIASTVVQLKEELRKRGLPVSGNKSDLIARLESVIPHPESALTNSNSQTSDYDTFTIKELKSILKRRNLSIAGTKRILVDRLIRDTRKIGKYEAEFKKRWLNFYEEIQDIVDRMPYVIGDQIWSDRWSSTVEWGPEDRWAAILSDYDGLDVAFERVNMPIKTDREDILAKEGQFDIEFAGAIKRGQKPFESSPATSTRFFATYPYLSYVLTMLSNKMIYYAVEAGQTTYLTVEMLRSAGMARPTH